MRRFRFDIDSKPRPTHAAKTVAVQKMNERTGNVLENKGPPCETQRRSWNIVENTWLIINMPECY
jgi:hypothetical protein